MRSSKLKVLFLSFILCFSFLVTACSKENISISSFDINLADFCVNYYVGDTVDLSTIGLTVTMSDGSTKSVSMDEVTIKVDGVECTLNDVTSKVTGEEGTKTVSIKYSDFEKTIEINVDDMESHISGIIVDTENVGTYEVGGEVTLDGINNDGSLNNIFENADVRKKIKKSLAYHMPIFEYATYSSKVAGKTFYNYELYDEEYFNEEGRYIYDTNFDKKIKNYKIKKKEIN